MDEHTLNLSAGDVELIITALAACTRSGGGSRIYHLTREISALTGVEPNDQRVVMFQRNATMELKA